MGWEQRERGTSYYTRSRRVDGEVRREYIGGGTLGKIAALEDECERRLREEDAAYWKEERKRLERRTAFLADLTEVVEVLTKAHLLAHGFHKHKGQWRRVREQQS